MYCTTIHIFEVKKKQTLEAGKKTFARFSGYSLTGRSLRSWHEIKFFFPWCLSTLSGEGVGWRTGESVRVSNNILRKNLVPPQFSFPCFSQDYVLFCHRVQNKVWCAFYKELLMACLCELPQPWSQPTSVRPTAPVYNTLQCVWPFMKGQKWTEKWLESKTCGPINIRVRQFSPFFPTLASHPISLSLSLSPTAEVPCVLCSASDWERVL